MHLRLLFVVLLGGFHAAVGAFELGLRDPEFNLSVPGVPSIAMHEQSASGGSAKRVLTGHDDTFSVDVELSRQPNEMSPRTCAGTILRTLVSQPGMPHRDSIYRAPLDAATFLVIYVRSQGQQEKFHAHLISSAGADHCVNAHFTRVAKAGQDVDDWRTTFTSARIAPPR